MMCIIIIIIIGTNYVVRRRRYSDHFVMKCMCVGVYPEQNDFELGTVVVLDTVSQTTDFELKRLV